MKRPGDGIPSALMNYVIGKKLKTDLLEDYKLKWEDLF
jgi:sialic acid synthase SpsE